MGLFEEAKQHFQEALGVDSDYEEAYFNLAVLPKYDDNDRAKSLLERALEIDPDYAAAHRELGVGATVDG